MIEKKKENLKLQLMQNNYLLLLVIILSLFPEQGSPYGLFIFSFDFPAANHRPVTTDQSPLKDKHTDIWTFSASQALPPPKPQWIKRCP